MQGFGPEKLYEGTSLDTSFGGDILQLLIGMCDFRWDAGWEIRSLTPCASIVLDMIRDV